MEEDKLIPASEAVRLFREFLETRAGYGDTDAQIIKKNLEAWVEGFRNHLEKLAQ